MVYSLSLLTVDREALEVGHSTRRRRFKDFEETRSKSQRSRKRNCSTTTWLQGTFRKVGCSCFPAAVLRQKKKERLTPYCILFPCLSKIVS